MQPIDMVLFCPRCHRKHVDEPGPGWDNPPHRSHLCASCGTIWRPADVPTNGVRFARTAGANDNWPRVVGAGGKHKPRPPVLTPDQVASIREWARAGVGRKHLARSFKVSVETISRAINGTRTYSGYLPSA